VAGTLVLSVKVVNWPNEVCAWITVSSPKLADTPTIRPENVPRVGSNGSDIPIPVNALELTLDKRGMSIIQN
jgi:hypothetical protein